MAKRRSLKGHITTENTLHCLLRWLSGGSYHDIRVLSGISKASFYRKLHQCMDEILQCKDRRMLPHVHPLNLLQMPPKTIAQLGRSPVH